MQEEITLFSMNVNTDAKSHLKDVAKWARFLAIVGFILLALFCIVSLISAVFFTDGYLLAVGLTVNETSSVKDVLIATIIGILILFIIAFFPLLFLLRFSNHLRIALDTDNERTMSLAFQHLKKCFRYIGVM